jgi:polysaccharide biosynthesis transport protein
MEYQNRGGTDIWAFVKLFKKRKLVFAAFFALTVIAVLVGRPSHQASDLALPPVYRSSVKLLVTPPSPSSEAGSGESLQTWFASEQLLRQLVLSEDLLSRVKESAELELEWEELKEMVTLAPASEGQEWGGLWQSFLIELTVTGNTPEQSKTISEVLVKEFISYTQELAAREVIASRKMLEFMALKNKNQIESAQQEIVSWRKKHDVWDIDQLLEAQGERIAELEEKREERGQKLAGLQQELTQLAAYQNGSTEALPWEVVEVSSQLNDLAAERESRKQELERLRKLYTEDNQLVQEQRGAYQESVATYNSERATLVESLIRNRQSKVAELQAVISRMDSEIGSLKNDKNLANSQVELENLKRDLQSYQSNYAELADRLNEARVQEERRRHLAAFTVVEKPIPGELVSVPGIHNSSTQTMVIALVMGLVVASAGTFAVQQLSVGMRLKPRVEELLELPVLTMLPRLDEKDVSAWDTRSCKTKSRLPVSGEPSSAILAHSKPDSLFAEKFRTLIVSVLRQNADVKKLMVVSCWPSEGKSMVCANLAASLAKFRLHVTLIDGDLRRPNLTKIFGAEGEAGLRQYLSGEVPLQELTIPTGIEDVSFLPSGRGDKNAAELLADERSFDPLLEGSDNRFLLIDSPPLSVCSDPILLAKQVDGVLLVVDANQFDGDGEIEYVQTLEDHGIPVFGVVLNGVKDSELHYGYSSRYKNYYTTPKQEKHSEPAEKNSPANS